MVTTSNTCPQCGTDAGMGKNFCDTCGMQLPDANIAEILACRIVTHPETEWTVGRCMHVVEAKRFCPLCGTDLTPMGEVWALLREVRRGVWRVSASGLDYGIWWKTSLYLMRRTPDFGHTDIRYMHAYRTRGEILARAWTLFRDGEFIRHPTERSFRLTK